MLATRRSHCDENSAPIPTAGPSMAPIVGLRAWAIGHHLCFSSADPRRPLTSPGTVARSARSVPAQNDPGTPVISNTTVSGSSSARPTVSMNSASMA